MKKEELMIGDWVTVSGKPMQVASIGATRVGFKDEGGYMFYNLYEEVKPIQTTDEILEKNGAEKSSNDRLYFANKLWERDELSNCWVIGRMNDAYDTPKFASFLSIRYVHELQHYINLFKIDKEVEI